MYSNWFSKNNHRFNKSPNKIIKEITWVYGDWWQSEKTMNAFTRKTTMEDKP